MSVNNDNFAFLLKSIPKILLFLIFSLKEDYSKALSSSFIKSKISLFFLNLLVIKLLIFSLTEIWLGLGISSWNTSLSKISKSSYEIFSSRLWGS